MLDYIVYSMLSTFDDYCLHESMLSMLDYTVYKSTFCVGI